MEQRLLAIERRLEELTHRLDDIEGRVRAQALLPFPTTPAESTDFALPTVSDLALTLGRGCLVLSGAYLLRSLTASDYWPRPAGVATGLIYAALAWLAAVHAASRARHLTALMYAASASLVAFPLLWENTGDANTLSYSVAAILWTTFGLAGLSVGTRYRRPAVFVSAVTVGLPIGAALLFRSEAGWPFLAALLTLALTTLTFARGRLSSALAWTPSALLITVTGFLCVGGLMPRTPDWLPPERLAALQWGVVVAYLLYFLMAALAGRARVDGADASAFFFVALVAALSSRLPWSEPGMARAMAAATASVAILAFWLAGRATPRSRWLWNAVAVCLLLDGTARATSGTAREVVWSLLAIGAARLTEASGLAWAAPLFGGALAWTSGLLAVGVGAADGASLGSGGTAHVLAAAVVLLLAFLMRTPASSTAGGTFAKSALLALLAVAVSATAFEAVRAVRDVVPLPILTVARLFVPTATGLGVLLFYRWTADPATRTVGLTAVILAGGQVVARDLFLGSPQHQLAALVALGAGLIGATLLLRRERPSGDR